MLIMDFRVIGEKLYKARKERGLTQSEVAETAGISERTYADIERGSVNMRIETFLKICAALNVTPNESLTEETGVDEISLEETLARLEKCTAKEKQTALHLLSVYLDSLNR